MGGLSPRRCQGVWSAQRPDFTEFAEGTGTYSRRTVWRVRLNPRHAALVIRRMHICKDMISFDFATRVRCVKGHQPCVTPSVETSECVTCSHGH
jgi:hypothetical protein